MKRVLLTGAILLVPALSANGQSAAHRGGQALGEALAPSNGRAYEDQYYRVMQAELAIQEARAARREADLAKLQADAAEQDRQIMRLMKDLWMKQGLPADEAAAIADTFKWDDEFNVMLARARHMEPKAMADEARLAYREHRYTQANQLLCAAYFAAVERNRDGAK